MTIPGNVVGNTIRHPVRTPFELEVQSRFGLVPHFFSSASSAPELIQQLWIFAKAAYLDNPLPPLFKERLFVYLSRFCEIRYCIVRHVGFLVGRGRPAGDPHAVPHSIEQAMRLLQRPVPHYEDVHSLVQRLDGLGEPLSLFPDPETEEEELLLAAASVLFLEPARCEVVKSSLRKVLGPESFEYLVGLMTFIRSAHYWTLMHPELVFEEDVEELLRQHERLSVLLLNDLEASRCDMGRRMFEELVVLRAAATKT